MGSNEQYDIVGDVHGMAATLRSLLDMLGYERSRGHYRHPEGRRLVFVGDIIDRGPDPLGCLDLVASLVDRGEALMILGNHELNAMHYMHEPPLREHSEKNSKQFRSTLHQIEAEPERWPQALAFLSSLPTRLELDGGALRIIHACWDEENLRHLPERIDTPELLRRTAAGGDLIDAVETCLKGPEEPWEPYIDKNGFRRDRRRIPWWLDHPREAPLTVFGHYWFPWRPEEGIGVTPETPRLLGSGGNAACVDYSVGRGGPLVALRYPELEFVAAPNLDLP